MKNQNVVNAMKIIMSEVNVLSTSSENAVGDAIAEVMMNEHRTIQQSFVRQLQRAIEQYSKSNTDLRNEASVKWAKDVAENQIPVPLI